MKKPFAIFWESYSFGGFSERPHFSRELGDITLEVRKQQMHEYAKMDANYKKNKKKLLGNNAKNG